MFYKGISLDPLLVCTYFAANASRSITNVHDFTPSRKSAKINETTAATGKVPPACMFSKGHFNYRLGCFIRHPHHTMGKPLRRVYPNPRMKFPSSLPCRVGPSTIKAFIARRSGLGSRPPCIYILRGSRTQLLPVPPSETTVIGFQKSLISEDN